MEGVNMGELFIPTDYANFTFLYTPISHVGSQPMTSFGFHLETGGIDGVLADLQASFQNLMDPFSHDQGVEGCRVTFGDDGGPPYVFQDVGFSGCSGTVTDDVVDPQICCLLKKVTLLPGRKGRGRNYLAGGPAPALASAGNWDSSFTDDVLAGFEAFAAAMGTAGAGDPVIFHPFIEGEGGTSPSDLSSASVETQCATQRRRNRN